jgi:hypothetical protein
VSDDRWYGKCTEFTKDQIIFHLDITPVQPAAERGDAKSETTPEKRRRQQKQKSASHARERSRRQARATAQRHRERPPNIETANRSGPAGRHQPRVNSAARRIASRMIWRLQGLVVDNRRTLAAEYGLGLLAQFGHINSTGSCSLIELEKRWDDIPPRQVSCLRSVSRIA